jgi:glucokinase
MPAPLDSFPWLVADIGGTNARFGLVRGPSAAVEAVMAMRCADYPSPQAAARHYLDQVASRDAPRQVAFAVATAVAGDTVKMTNSPWTISAAATRAALGADHVLLINDFEALALALPQLGDADVRMIGGQTGGQRIDRRLPMAVIGPGTGLGVAGCLPNAAGGWTALATEGGHVTLAASDEREDELLRAARRERDHVSAERLLSGIGMPVLYRAVASVYQLACDATLDTPEITRRGLAGTDPACVATLEAFCALLGSFAGNVALTLGARGGVLIAGGVAEQLAGYLPGSQFRQRFEAKGRFRDYLAPIATALITAPHVALRGAAQGIVNHLAAEQGAPPMTGGSA